MATSAEKDDRDDDEKDTAASDEEQAAGTKVANTAANSDKASDADNADDKDEDEDDDDDDDDDDDEEEEEAKPAAKPAATRPATSAAAAPQKADKGAPAAVKRSAAGPAVRRPAKGKALPPQTRGSLGKTMILFVIIVGGLASAFVLLSREDNTPPKWSPGQTVDVDVTLVPSDAVNLGCAAPDSIAGKRCAFEAAGKPTPNLDPKNDVTLLRPYSTTGNLQFFGAGLWSNPGLAPTLLPKDETRFTAHCKFKVEGTIKKAQVRWRTDGPWLDWNDPHYAGSLTDCKLVP
jgi:hypothetical protein